MISLQPFEQRYTEELFHLFESDERRHLLDLPLSTLSTFKKWINELEASEFLGFGVGRVVINTHLRQPIGLVILSQIDFEAKTAEMGTWLGSQYRGKGMNPKVKELMLEYAFNKLGLEKILFFTSEQNIASIRGLNKLPYIQLANQEEYLTELKQRKFLHRKPFLVFEVRKMHFLHWKKQNGSSY